MKDKINENYDTWRRRFIKGAIGGAILYITGLSGFALEDSSKFFSNLYFRDNPVISRYKSDKKILDILLEEKNKYLGLDVSSQPEEIQPFLEKSRSDTAWTATLDEAITFGERDLEKTTQTPEFKRYESWNKITRYSLFSMGMVGITLLASSMIGIKRIFKKYQNLENKINNSSEA